MLVSAINERWSAYLILAIFIASMIIVSVLSSKKAKSLDGFLLGDRGIGGWMSAFGYGTTYFSGVVFIGYAGTFGMSLGLSAVWIGLANALVGSLLAWFILAKRTRAMSQSLNAKTLPEFFEKRYSSSGLKLLSAIVIFIFLIPYSTSVYQGIAYISEAVFGLDFVWCVVIMAVIASAYLFIGGYFANAVSNFIQGIIMLVGVIIMIALMLASSKVNGAEGLNKLIESGYGFFPSSESAGFWFDSPLMMLITNMLITSVGIWAVPQSIQKFFAIRNNRAIVQGTVISTLFALIVGGGAYFNGSLARLFFPEMPATGTANIIPDMLLSNELMGYGILGFICILVLAASMSTLSSLALVSASSLGVDVYKGFIKKDASEAHVKKLVSILCIIFVMLSAVLAILEIDAIVTLMSLSWGTLAGCFLGPYIFGLYSKKANKLGAFLSIGTTLVTTIVLIFVFGAVYGGNTFSELISLGIKKSPIIGVTCMILSMIVTPIGMLFNKNEKIKVKNENLELSFKEIQ